MRHAHLHPAPKRPPRRESRRTGRRAFQGRRPVVPGVRSAGFRWFSRRLRNLAYLPENDVGPGDVVQAQDFLPAKRALESGVAAPHLTGKAPKRRFGRLGLAFSFRFGRELAVSGLRPVPDAYCVSMLEPGGLSQCRLSPIRRLPPLDAQDLAKAVRLRTEGSRGVSRFSHGVNSRSKTNTYRAAHILFVLFTVLPVGRRTHIICEQRPDESHNS